MKSLIGNIAGKRMLLLLALLWPAMLMAQFSRQEQEEPKSLAPVSDTYAITNATVYQAPGRKTEGATVVIKDGLITAVGKNVDIPAEAVLIEGDSLHVYAGFIDGLSHAGVPKPKEERRERPDDPANPTPEYAGITPEVDVRTLIKPEDKSLQDLRALGFTTAHVVPYGRMLPGNGAIIQLTGDNTDRMVLVNNASMYSQLAGARRAYPATVIAVMAKWRELYHQARLAKDYQSVYAANPSGLSRPETDRILEAFYPVIDRKLPVFFEADRYLDVQRVLALQSDLGFSLWVGNIKEGWDAIPDLKSAGAKVFLSLELPEDKKDDKKGKEKGGEKGEGVKKADGKKEDKPSGFQPGEKEALEKRKAEAMAKYNGQAVAFQKAGIPFGFSTVSVKPADIRVNLRRMISAGLSKDQALAALTTSPAQLLGIDDQLGTIDRGKIANLVASDKPFFDEKANVRYVFVDGTMYKYDPKATPKPDPSAVVVLAGTWTVVLENSEEHKEYSVTFEKEGVNYKGSITGEELAQAVPLENVTLNGNTLKYAYTVGSGGQSYRVDVEATVGADSWKGTAAAGTAGAYTLEAKKGPDR